MSQNIKQIFDTHPAVSFQNTDLMYLGRTPYGTTDNFAFQYSTLFSAVRAGALLAANNLGDVANAAAARTNLGLGTASTFASTAFLQTTNNLSDVPVPATARTNLGLGTAATFAATAFLQGANNLSDVANAATSRTNLGLGTAATFADTAFLQNVITVAFTRDMTSGSGLQTISTVGFTPKQIVIFGTVDGSVDSYTSWGMSSTGSGVAIYLNIGSKYEGSAIINLSSGVNSQVATIFGLTGTGFTLDWTATGVNAGTANLFAMCIG